MAHYAIIMSNSSTVEDRAQAAYYVKLSDESAINAGGKVLVNADADNITQLEGSYKYPRCKIYEFPDEESARNWHYGEEYQSAYLKRPPGFDVTKILVPEFLG